MDFWGADVARLTSGRMWFRAEPSGEGGFGFKGRESLHSLNCDISIMKQQFVVTHRYKDLEAK
jgi:hypothetical protein